MNKKIWDVIGFAGVPLGARYYGIVSDVGGFVRGCAPVPGLVASGPTGTGAWGWDTDGSCGDWYGGHELAHAYGRGPANFCSATGGPSYPYTAARISPALSGNTAIYGFSVATKAIYGPTWRDVMSYYTNQWISDFTYEALMTTFRTTSVALAAEQITAKQASHLLVLGAIDPRTNQVALDLLFVIPNVGDVEPRIPGSYAMMLQGAGGAALARYPFTPDLQHGGPMPPRTAPRAEQLEDQDLLGISELVPYVEGTTRVEIQGPDGILHQVTAGANTPTVTIISPNGGELLDGETILVSWTASDAYDVDAGTMDGSQLTWRSDLAGPLGSGSALTVRTLQEGLHTITLRADDGEGGLATATVQITVVSDLGQAPAAANALVVSDDLLTFSSRLGERQAAVLVDNQHGPQTHSWNAFADQPWVRLSADVGQTPDDLRVQVSADGLPNGLHTAAITLPSPEMPDQAVLVQVEPSVDGAPPLLLPLFLRNQ
ncbi:MAG: hypothetical protein GX605_03920 [Chloroflexi bacterium]|nr:hypothetical protein [Chloroflexota bacterium]